MLSCALVILVIHYGQAYYEDPTTVKIARQKCLTFGQNCSQRYCCEYAYTTIKSSSLSLKKRRAPLWCNPKTQICEEKQKIINIDCQWSWSEWRGECDGCAGWQRFQDRIININATGNGTKCPEILVEARQEYCEETADCVRNEAEKSISETNSKMGVEEVK